MCRFLLVKSNKPIKPYKLLELFSLMAKKSKAFDGDWQGDGWGIDWMVNKKWNIIKSLSPIWKDEHKFFDFPSTTIFAVHARSASFPQHKNNLEYNQPFINDSTVFVFNGLLKGVSLSLPIPGKIGAQKIWHLIKQELKVHSPSLALERVKNLLLKNTREIQAINIGLIHHQEIFSLNYFTKHSNYYQLHCFKNNLYNIVSSEKLEITAE